MVLGLSLVAVFVKFIIKHVELLIDKRELLQCKTKSIFDQKSRSLLKSKYHVENKGIPLKILFDNFRWILNTFITTFCSNLWRVCLIAHLPGLCGYAYYTSLICTLHACAPLLSPISAIRFFFLSFVVLFQL